MIELFQQFWPHVSGLLILLIMIGTAGHAILYKRDSRSAVAWVGLILFSPLFGAVLYFLFGINRVRRAAHGLKEPDSLEIPPVPPPGAEGLPAADLEGLFRMGNNITGQPLTGGNRVEPLLNGDEAYPAMLEAIRMAEVSIGCSTYIFNNDPVGRMFVDAFAAAVARGVEVRILVDDVGARYSFPSIVGLLKRRGVPVARFHPAFFRRKLAFINLRTHRKILCIDGQKAFIGGINIRESHWLARNPRHPVEDLHFSVEGPVVAQLRTVFASDWAITTREKLEDDIWKPDLSKSGDAWARSVADGPDDQHDKIRWMLIGAIGAAQKSVKIVTPYFLPDSGLSTVLNSAALRGVEVDVILPNKGNLPFVDWATQAILWQNVIPGCRIWKTAGPFDHSKVMLVDDSWVFFGSANWDPRSLRLNFELNVETFCPSLAKRIAALIEEKKTRARPVLLDELDGRPLPVKLRDGIARLMSPYL